MKTLELHQMEQIEGGIVCAIVGATLSVAFTPWIGIPAGIACHLSYGAIPAY